MTDNDSSLAGSSLRRAASRWPGLGGFMHWLHAWVHLGRHRREAHQHDVAVVQRLDALDAAGARLAQRLEEVERQAARAAEQLTAAQAAFAQALQEAERRIAEGARRELLDAQARTEARLLDLLQLATADHSRHWNLQHSVLLRQLMDRLAPGASAAASAASADGELEGFQWALAGAFRGPRDAIRERLHAYLDTVRETALRFADRQIVDLGCGRGEWLELLRDSGLEAVGVDASPLAIEHCRHDGYTVHAADAMEWLRAQPADQCAVISAFHLVEHLPPERLLALLREAWRVLTPGGLLVLETPNPENLLVATRMFHRDPTHRAPLPPELLEFMVQWVGFRDTRVLRLTPYPESFRLPGSDAATRALDALLHGPQDYAVLAYAA